MKEAERPLPEGPFPKAPVLLLVALAATATTWVWTRPELPPVPPTPDLAGIYYDLITVRAESLPDTPPPTADPDAAIERALRHLETPDLDRFSSARTVTELLDAWLESWRELDPDAAVELGLERSPTLTRYTLAYTYQSVLDDALALKRLRELEPDPESLDARIFEAFLEGGLLSNEWDGGRLRDPRVALWGIQACYTILAPMNRANEADWAIVADRLDQVPEVVRQVQDRLSDPPAVWIELALQDLEGTQAFLDECTAAARGPRIEKGARRARDALEAYARHLRRLLPTAGPTPAGRVDSMVWRLRSLEFSRRSPAGLAHVLLEECSYSADRHAELLEAAERDTPRRELTFREYMEAFPKRIEWAREFAEQEGIASVPDGHPVLLTITPGHLRSWEAAALYSTQALADRPRPMMMVTPWKNHESANQTFSETYLKLVALHETYPGHHLHDVRTRLAGGSKMRRLYASNWLLEGWATYCERLALRGALADDGVTYAEWHSQRNVLAWQSLMELCLTAGTITEGEATNFLIHCIGYDRSAARIQIANMTLYPLHTLGYLMGDRAILDLRDELRKKLGERFDLREFHDRLLTYGRAPVALVRKDMLRTWK